MAKRRRERDKPKAGPDAAYNPNKRTLLSYDSDEEAQDATLSQAVVAQSHSSVRADGWTGLSTTVKAEQDVAKRSDLDERNVGLAIPEELDWLEAELEDGVQSEQLVPQDVAPTRIVKNSVTGLYPALGSVTYQYEDGDEDDEYASTEEDAMAYLRSVRSERQHMPMLMRAAPMSEDEELYESGVGDSRGYFEDGAYIARPSQADLETSDMAGTITPQQAYTEALKARFQKQRILLQASPSAEAVAKLDDQHPITLPRGSNKAWAQWTRLVRTVPPSLTQIQAMDQDNVIKVLELIKKQYLQPGKAIEALVGAWIWALIARLDDVGTMTNDRVSALREFAKQAVLVQVSLHDPDAAAQLQNIAEQEAHDLDCGATGTPDEALANGSFSNCAGTNVASASNERGVHIDEAAESSTLATLDMIITVVGDVFGQRDLLEFRRSWIAEAEPA